jgi:hypothetical protein
MSAVAVVKDVFAARNIGTDQLPAVSGPSAFLDEITGSRSRFLLHRG